LAGAVRQNPADFLRRTPPDNKKASTGTPVEAISLTALFQASFITLLSFGIPHNIQVPGYFSRRSG
jgi:hypothetical protein